jgi:solute carrier family 66 (lysosomal lysine-arginine transporter), member 1
VTGLAPTPTALAGYFCISDLILITQCTYYNIRNARRNRRLRAHSSGTASSEDEPLLRRRSSLGLPSSHVRHSRHEESSLDPIKRALAGEDETPDSSPWLNNALSILAIYIVGITGWFVSYRVGAWDTPDGATAPDASSPAGISGMVLGYASALCYLWYGTATEVSSTRETDRRIVLASRKS